LASCASMWARSLNLIFPEMPPFAPGANRLPRPIVNSEIGRSASNLASRKAAAEAAATIAVRRPPRQPCVAVLQPSDPPPPGQAGLLFFGLTLSAPISRAALRRPGRSVPSNNRHFYSRCR
jgi:hypothetical protein